jgi:uncharacterized membrane protein YphA (DoxX/SURF4 family)
MLSAVFISGGIDTWRNPAAKAPAAEPIAPRVASALPISLPQDTEQLVKIDAATKVVAGVMLATNRLPRLAALTLGAGLVPTTLAAHRFWEESDPGARRQQQNHFFKNVGLLGGLLLAAVDTEGRPSLRWRAAHAGTAVKAKAVDALPIG